MYSINQTTMVRDRLIKDRALSAINSINISLKMQFGPSSGSTPL